MTIIPEFGVMIQQKVRKKKSQCSFSVQPVTNHGTKITYTSQYCVCEHREVF